MAQKLIQKNIVTALAGTDIDTARTAVVVPCYNEAKRLDITAFAAYLEQSPNTTLVFVNDGSKDATLERLFVLRDIAPDQVVVVDLYRNSGKAEAVRQGLIAATDIGAAFVGYWDADLATPLDAIDDFSRVLMKFAETQVVYGARRALLGHRIERTIGRRIVSRICATLARQAVRLPVGDTQCGAKMLRNTALLRNAVSTPFTAGWLFDVELFTRLSMQMTDRRFAFYEQPLAEWTEVAGSKVSARAIVKSGFRMLLLIAESRLGVAGATRVSERQAVANVVSAPSVAKVA